MKSLTRAEMMLMGSRFINITGLPYSHSFCPEDDGKTIQANHSEYGCWDYNNGICVVVTEEGRVWIRFSCKHERFMKRVAPNGRGAWVPLSNGESIDSVQLLQRLHDPLCDFNGMHSPDACLEKAMA